jgi:hypothetical protein
VVLIDPLVIPTYGASQKVVLVNFSSVPADSSVPFDKTCVVQDGEHPFIHHASYAYYGRMRVDALSHVLAMVAQGIWKTNTPCSPALLAKLRAGVCASSRTQREFKKIFACP